MKNRFKRFLKWLIVPVILSLLASLFTMILHGIVVPFDVASLFRRAGIILLILVPLKWIARRLSRGGSEAVEEAEAKTVNSEDLVPTPVSSRVGFADIAGYEQVKNALRATAASLNSPEGRATRLHGLLLYGPPGTGKTLFAKAMASEVGVPFYAVSASEFTNRLVGQGARNVRQLYDAARRHPVSVIFIDEIDAIGRARQGDGQEERMTLNQLLAEMDGFEQGNSFVFTIAATNDKDSLDEALVRPGRFDRLLHIPLPSRSERLDILRVHAAKLPMGNVDLEPWAIMTQGFSGAKLAALMRGAEESAASRGEGCLIENADMDLALMRLMLDGEPVRLTNPSELRATAYHEAGHALAGKLLLDQIIARVSVIGSTGGMMGWTLRVFRDEDMKAESKTMMERNIIAVYAGRAAEQLMGVPDNVGSSNDVAEATKLIESYVSRYGFGDAPVTGEWLDMSTMVHSTAKRLYAETEAFVREHQPELTSLAEALMQRETLYDRDVDEIVRKDS